MPDKTCKSCRWWEEGERCDRGNSLPELAPAVRFEAVDRGDAYGSYVVLYTGPDFGCIHHDPR